jgi:hypothetical protein
MLAQIPAFTAPATPQYNSTEKNAALHVANTAGMLTFTPGMSASELAKLVHATGAKFGTMPAELL